MVEFSPLRDGLPRRCPDRIAMDGDAAWQPVAGMSAVPGEGQLRSAVSRVPKCEAPGAPTIVVKRLVSHRGHPPSAKGYLLELTNIDMPLMQRHSAVL
jgi:hypothetical protein